MQVLKNILGVVTGMMLYSLLFDILFAIFTFIFNTIYPLWPFRIIPEWITVPFLCAVTAWIYMLTLNLSGWVCNKISRKPNTTISITDIVFAVILVIELIFSLIFAVMASGLTDCSVWVIIMITLFMLYRLWSEIKILKLAVNHMGISFLEVGMLTFNRNVSFGFGENYIVLIFLITFIINIIF